MGGRNGYTSKRFASNFTSKRYLWANLMTKARQVLLLFSRSPFSRLSPAAPGCADQETPGRGQRLKGGWHQRTGRQGRLARPSSQSQNDGTVRAGRALWSPPVPAPHQGGLRNAPRGRLWNVSRAAWHPQRTKSFSPC